MAADDLLKRDHVVAHLRSGIDDCVYLPGSLLPGEPTLSRQLGVSRWTVRRAFAVLEQEGRIVGQRGRGWMVKGDVERLEIPASTFRSDLFSDDPVMEDVVGRDEAPREVADVLTTPATGVLSYRRLLAVHRHRPVAMLESYAVPDVWPSGNPADRKAMPLEGVARLSTAEESQALHLSPNSLVLALWSTTAVSGQLVEVGLGVYPADAWKLVN